MNSTLGLMEANASAALHLAAIVEFSDDAILSKDLNGIITSWNAAASRLFGYSAEEIVGKSVTLIIPPELSDEEPAILERVRNGTPIEHYETVRIAKDGTRYDISLSVSPLKDSKGRIIGASTIARDITDRKRSERLLLRQQRRLEKIDQISRLIASELDLDRVARTVIDIATQVSGAELGAFLCDVQDEQGRLLCAFSAAPGRAAEKLSLPGHALQVDTLVTDGKIVRLDDSRSAPRDGRCFPFYQLPDSCPVVASYLAIPIVGRSRETVGGLFFAHSEPSRFSQDTEDDIAAIAAHAAIAINNAKLHRAARDEIARRCKAEEAMELMLHEMKHRLKNSLGIAQAIVNQTFEDVSRERRLAFGARLQALSQAHDLLTLGSWHRAPIGEIVRHAVEPFQEHGRERFTFTGPVVELAANRVLLLAMVLHELGTNAVKYGALSKPDGHVDIGWKSSECSSKQLLLVWRECGGPPVESPQRKGFGSKLIERALRSDGGKSCMEFARTGLVCELLIPVN